MHSVGTHRNPAIRYGEILSPAFPTVRPCPKRQCLAEPTAMPRMKFAPPHGSLTPNRTNNVAATAQITVRDLQSVAVTVCAHLRSICDEQNLGPFGRRCARWVIREQVGPARTLAITPPVLRARNAPSSKDVRTPFANQMRDRLDHAASDARCARQPPRRSADAGRHPPQDDGLALQNARTIGAAAIEALWTVCQTKRSSASTLSQTEKLTMMRGSA